jgi:leucyl-tRNA synthetase
MVDPTQGGMTRDQLERFARILWPFAPHFADELGARLGVVSTTGGGFFGGSWPVCEPAMLVDDEVEMPVQIQGKIKARLMVPAKADAAAIEALVLAHPEVVAAIAGRTVKKTVVVPGRMVNIVV